MVSMPSPRSLLLLPLAALALAGCSAGDDGPSTTQTRDLAAFTSIDNRDSADLELHVGERQRVQVRAGEKVIDDVRTEVVDGALEITFDDDDFFGDGDVVVEAWVPRLDVIVASGSGDIRGDGIDADAFEVRGEGSADIELRGTAASLVVELDGSGDAELADLTAREARVLVDGSGDADIHAVERLDVTVDGSGDVRYHGDPQVIPHVDGSGELTQAG
jgi:hypothetical protein